MGVERGHRYRSVRPCRQDTQPACDTHTSFSHPTSTHNPPTHPCIHPCIHPCTHRPTVHARDDPHVENVHGEADEEGVEEAEVPLPDALPRPGAVVVQLGWVWVGGSWPFSSVIKGSIWWVDPAAHPIHEKKTPVRPRIDRIIHPPIHPSNPHSTNDALIHPPTHLSTQSTHYALTPLTHTSQS